METTAHNFTTEAFMKALLAAYGNNREVKIEVYDKKTCEHWNASNNGGHIACSIQKL